MQVIYKALSRILLGAGIAVIAVIAVPAILLVMTIVGIWSFLNCMLSRLEQKASSRREDQVFSQDAPYKHSDFGER